MTFFIHISQDYKFKTEVAQITFIVLQSLYINKCLFCFYLHFKRNVVKTSEKKLLLKVCNFGDNSGTNGNCKNIFFYRCPKHATCLTVVRTYFNFEVPQAFKSQISETYIKSSEIQNERITLKQQTFHFLLIFNALQQTWRILLRSFSSYVNTFISFIQMLLVLPEEVRLICVLHMYFVILIPLELNISVIYLHKISEQITYCLANSGVLWEILPQSYRNVSDCGIFISHNDSILTIIE